MIEQTSGIKLLDLLKLPTNAFLRAQLYTMTEIAQYAERQAKLNARTQFIGRNSYTLSGNLWNHIYNRIDYDKKDVSAFIGVRGVPYARIHELGGVITNKNWKYLWMRSPIATKKGNPFRRLKPAEFWELAKHDSRFFYLRDDKGGVTAMFDDIGPNEPIPLFFLRKKVKMPKRAYLLPAVLKAKVRIEPTHKRWLKKLGLK
jgi:phage gpG-like protein